MAFRFFGFDEKYGLNNKENCLKHFIYAFVLTVSGCVVVPHSDNQHTAKCEISTDRKTLKVANVAKETNTYYSLSGIIATPILYPTSAIISAGYVAVHNAYNFGEEKIRCE